MYFGLTKHVGREVDCAACGLRGTIIRTGKFYRGYPVTVKFDEGFIVSYTARGKLENETVLSLVPGR